MSNYLMNTACASAAARAKGDLAECVALSRCDRAMVEIAIVSALTADRPALEAAVRNAYAAGVSESSARDITRQLAAYLGFVRVAPLAALVGPGESDEEGHPTPAVRYRTGIDAYATLNPQALSNIEAAFGAMAGSVIQCTFRSFADTFAASSIPIAKRQMITVAALAALGTAAPQLAFHIGAARDVGVSDSTIIDIIGLVQWHAGMPAAYNALTAAKSAFATGPGATPGYQ